MNFYDGPWYTHLHTHEHSYIYIYKTVMFDRVFAFLISAVCVSRRRLGTCFWPKGSPKYAMVLRWSNRRARDHRSHVAPRRKPNPASQRSQLTKLYFEHVSFSKNRTVFSQTCMRRSVGISRICRVKKFQNPSFKVQQSTRIDRIARNTHSCIRCQ